jgi:hypothetical protein
MNYPKINKWDMAKEGYTYLKYLGNKEHLLQNIDGNCEVWFANKNHASYGLVYKNTHLEFAHSA